MSDFSGVPNPVSLYPPATSRSLESWLGQPSADAPVEAPSRLREIADNRAVDISLAAVALAGGIVVVLFGAYWSIMGLVVPPVIIFSIIGAALILLGRFALRLARSRLPKDERARIVRSSGTARGGITAAAMIWVVTVVMTSPAWPAASARDGGWALLMGFYLFLALLLVTCFVVPSIVLGRARESLRRVAEQDGAYRALLEHDRLTWHPRYGDQMYGPL